MASQPANGNAGHEVRLGRFNLDLNLWLRGWIAFQRILLAALIVAAHAGYQHVLQAFFGEEMQQLHKLFVAIGAVALASLDAWLLIEAVRIFLPPPWGVELTLVRSLNESASITARVD